MTDLLIRRINNTILSWNSCAFKADLDPFEGIVEFDYEQARERKIVHGMRRDGTPLGKTSGKYSVKNVMLKMLRDSADVFTDYLTVKGLGSYGDAEFTLTCEYFEPGHKPIIVIVEGCTIDGEKDGNVEGTDELATEFLVGALTLTKNGKRLWSVQRELTL